MLDLPPVVLGCGNFGGIGSAPEFFGRGDSEEQAVELMDAAWELGVRWFDTADAYGGGRSETYIGRWIRSTGQRPQLTTKTFNPMHAGGEGGLARDRILRQIESSLERLGVDRVDLYLAHEWDPEVPLAETVGALEALVERGVVGAWGVSNFDGRQLREAAALGRPAAIQNSYSLLERGDEADVIPACVEERIAYQAFSPLAGGWLAGKYRRGEEPPSGSRMTMRPEPYRHLDDERVWSGLEALEARARERSVSTAGLALAWAVAAPGVASVVVGPRRPEHLEPVREARGLELSRAEHEELGGLFS